ncbi:MAG: hypothetical protein OIN88_14885 [Candidatus Methanoperedens sp.]|nr:hypothetical protein [Candidatus Methanoperedens sp.]MCZ7360020.1 hypothetical protein [Candidatus Methanoperedens sp.]HLB70214.1 hypothetical protein [Candidatus Methanoperedens sp.]
MVVRKNISLETSHVKKLEPLIKKHSGNLSAAIRDAVDLAEAALHRYGTVEKAISSITVDEKELMVREKSMEPGKNVVLRSPIFHWLIKKTRGITIDKEILDELLDPLKINSILELDKTINRISTESGWNCKISLFCPDDVNPTTVAVEGENQYHRDFLAQLVVMFLVHNRCLDIDAVHRRATSIRIDLKSREEGTQPLAAIELFGYLNDAMDEFISKQDFWKNLIEIYSAVNYNMVSLHRDQYENLLASSTIPDTGIFESLSRKHIMNIPHPDFLKLLKRTHESLLIVDTIGFPDNREINIYHNYRNENAVLRLRDYYLSLLRANGHEYEAKCSASMMVLTHVCCSD